MDESIEWDALRLLIALDSEGSFRRAATVVGLSQPTLSRRVRALEEALGHPLLLRNARGVELTTEGRAVLEAARVMREQVEALQRGLDGRKASVEGRVRVSCTEPVAMELLPPILMTLRRDYPQLSVDVVVDAHASDLDRREADLAIRMFQPRRANLVARRVGATFTGFYASRAYLERKGVPVRLQDLRAHDVVGPDRDRMFVSAAMELGFSPADMTFRTDSFATTLSWVRAGMCIGALVGAIAHRDADLVQVLEPLNRYPVWLVSHPDLFGSAAVRAVWDRLAADLPGQLESGF